jgi:hypothetical protein
MHRFFSRIGCPSGRTRLFARAHQPPPATAGRNGSVLKTVWDQRRKGRKVAGPTWPRRQGVDAVGLESNARPGLAQSNGFNPVRFISAQAVAQTWR